MKTRMYAGTKTWNPYKGCRFDCIYCKPSFQNQAKRQKQLCDKCYRYEPHEHPERLHKIPNAEIIFVAGNGDISFANPKFIFKIIDSIKEHNKRNPDKTYYFQSKNPSCLKQYLGDFPENVILVTTLETNRDSGYQLVSKAPKPSARYKDFARLDWQRKVVTIEPVMDFDEPIFLEWIKEINPEYIWFGFNSRPKQVQLPEPSMEKAQSFINSLSASGIEVRGKELRGLTID